MLFYQFTYLLVIILSITCRTLSSIPIKTHPSEGKSSIVIFFRFEKFDHFSDSFITNNEEFIPTNEWQIVKEGMN